MQNQIFDPSNIVGIGLRHPHHNHVLNKKPKVPWLEIHSENFFAQGGPLLSFIKQIREIYPISLHCVGLSLGSATKVNEKHLKQVANLAKEIDPFLISDHISWSNVGKKTLNDLLPIPYTEESLKIICDNIDQTQGFLKRQILVENPSTYLSFTTSRIEEHDFINQIAKRTGCRILLDINNIYVSSQNNNFDAAKYIEKLDQEIVGEMHLAGHSVNDIDGQEVLIDTHNDYVCDAVWDLFKIASRKFKNVPTLIEWDQDIPEFQELEREAKRAQDIINSNNCKTCMKALEGPSKQQGYYEHSQTARGIC